MVVDAAEVHAAASVVVSIGMILALRDLIDHTAGVDHILTTDLFTMTSLVCSKILADFTAKAS
jgi:hypothetical protein